MKEEIHGFVLLINIGSVVHFGSELGHKRVWISTMCRLPKRASVRLRVEKDPVMDDTTLSLVVRIHLEDREMKEVCPIPVESRAQNLEDMGVPTVDGGDLGVT